MNIGTRRKQDTTTTCGMRGHGAWEVDDLQEAFREDHSRSLLGWGLEP